MTQVMASLAALVSCTGSTNIDCTGLNQLYQSLVTVATSVVAPFTNLVTDIRAGASASATATLSAQLATAVSGINSAISPPNQPLLNASGLLLNGLIGLASNTQYGNSSQAMIFVYDSAGYAAGCAGNTLNINDRPFFFSLPCSRPNLFSL